MNVLYVGPVLPEYTAALEELLGSGFRLDCIGRIGPGDLARVERADVLLGLGLMSAETIQHAYRARLIQVLGAGYDNVDLCAAARSGIPVATTNGSNAISVAEHAFALLLSLVRRMAVADRAIREGGWPQFDFYRGGLQQLSGKTLGLIGFGHVGQALARMAAGFSMRSVYFKRERLPAESEQRLGVTYAALDELLASSDAVSIQVPLTDQTRGLIGTDQLSRMQPNALLVNVSRGGVVDQVALIDALTNGRLGGAGLDVFEHEPLEPGSPLRQLDNVVLTPHVGGAAQEAIQRTFEVAVENIFRLRSGDALHNVIGASS